MEDTAQAGQHDPSMRAFAAAVERFGRLLQTLASAQHGSADFAQALQSLRASLAADLEGWLRSAHPFAEWWLGTPAPAPWSTSPGPATGGPCSADLSRLQGLLSDWPRLQSQLAAHWATIAQAASQKFVQRLGAATAGEQLTDPRWLYDVWIDCAEAAYAETAHSDAFCRVMAELISATVALRLQSRQYAQSWAHAADLPTRAEFEALQRQVQELQGQVQALQRQAQQPAPRGRRGKPEQKNNRKSARKRQRRV